MKLMKRLLGILLALAVLAVGILYWQGTRDDASTGPAAAAAALAAGGHSHAHGGS